MQYFAFGQKNLLKTVLTGEAFQIQVTLKNGKQLKNKVQIRGVKKTKSLCKKRKKVLIEIK